MTGVAELTPEELEKCRPKPLPNLSSLTIEGFADYIKAGRAKKIVVLCGAGMSVAAGIPDFRTPGTGLYSNLQKYNLPHPEAIFDISFFPKHPEAFFKLSSEICPGRFNPTLAHYFCALLARKQILKRLYTQNIDGLDRLAGVPDDLLVEAHGTFSKSHCLKCNKEYTFEELRTRFESGEVIRCDKEDCDGLVKPDIVFFGESLPVRFMTLIETDIVDCDMLIVIGTSLVVMPFASLVEAVKTNVPRVLFNKEMVGTYKERLKVEGKEVREVGNCFLFKFGHLLNRRDLYVGGDCQESMWKFARLLGWDDELLAMLPSELRAKFNTDEEVVSVVSSPEVERKDAE
jgi:NAD-dependent SIR2 family protein deacetylase